MFFILNGIFILLSYLAVALILTVIIIKTIVKPTAAISSEITTQLSKPVLSNPDEEEITDKIKTTSTDETKNTSPSNTFYYNMSNINYVVVYTDYGKSILNIINPSGQDLQFMDVEFNEVLKEPYFEIQSSTNMIINNLNNNYMLYLTYNNQLKKFELSRDTSIIKLSKSNYNIIYLINDPSKMLIYKNNLVDLAPSYNLYLKIKEYNGKYTLEWYDEVTNTNQLITINTYKSFHYESYEGNVYHIFIYDSANKKNYFKITDTIILTTSSMDATLFTYDRTRPGLCVFKNLQTNKNNYLIYNITNNSINITDSEYYNEVIKVLDKITFDIIYLS